MDKVAFMQTDLQIAQNATRFPISGITASAGIPADAAEPYESYKAKVDPHRIDVDADGNISGLF